MAAGTAVEVAAEAPTVAAVALAVVASTAGDSVVADSMAVVGDSTAEAALAVEASTVVAGAAFVAADASAPATEMDSDGRADLRHRAAASAGEEVGARRGVARALDDLARAEPHSTRVFGMGSGTPLEARVEARTLRPGRRWPRMGEPRVHSAAMVPGLAIAVTTVSSVEAASSAGGILILLASALVLAGAGDLDLAGVGAGAWDSAGIPFGIGLPMGIARGGLTTPGGADIRIRPGAGEKSQRRRPVDSSVPPGRGTMLLALSRR